MESLKASFKRKPNATRTIGRFVNRNERREHRFKGKAIGYRHTLYGCPAAGDERAFGFGRGFKLILAGSQKAIAESGRKRLIVLDVRDAKLVVV